MKLIVLTNIQREILKSGLESLYGQVEKLKNEIQDIHDSLMKYRIYMILCINVSILEQVKLKISLFYIDYINSYR